MGRAIEVTDQFNEWYDGLNEADDDAVSAAIEYLAERGPGLGRPFVDTIDASRIGNMKELRPKRSDIHILFVFDPRRTAIPLIGGSKTDDWQGWYKRNIPEAERLYAAYLEDLKKEGRNSMSGHRPWSEVRHKRPAEREAAIAEDVRVTLRENALAQLRRRNEISQEELAAALGVSQARISSIERADEPQLRTMRRFIEALGGELIVQAKLDGETFDLLARE